MWGGMYEGGWGMGYGIMGMAHGLLWLVLIGLGIAVLARSLRNDGRSAPPQEESALDVLKKRYARGEIDKDEFEQKKRDLLS